VGGGLGFVLVLMSFFVMGCFDWHLVSGLGLDMQGGGSGSRAT
jgi:predicted small secreted protein